MATQTQLTPDSLQKSTLTSVHSEVMGMLASFEADALPVVVRFLLQTGYYVQIS